ncbi:MAG: protein translocase subunit SecF [Thiohalomonadaceae bacterium]
MEIFHFKKDLQVMRWRKVSLSLSLLFTIISIVALSVRGLNLGVDFTGGTVLEVSYAQSVNLDSIRQALEDSGMGHASVQNFGTTRDALIRLPIHAEMSTAQFSAQVFDVLKAQDASAELRRVEFVGPQVGQELYENGGLALIVVGIGIMIYLAMRFEWRFAVAAIIANVHDVLTILGIFALFQLEFNLTVLAGVLAVLGYSVNESVVVFDRVRENFRTMRKASVAEVINNAITRTMSRTVITHFSTELAVLAVLFLGGEMLHNFAIALTIGILFGIYSSILVGSPIAMWLGVSREHMMPVKKEGVEEMEPEKFL